MSTKQSMMEPVLGEEWFHVPPQHGRMGRDAPREYGGAETRRRKPVIYKKRMVYGFDE
jgi:hypothetical protein